MAQAARLIAEQKAAPAGQKPAQMMTASMASKSKAQR
jgi:hypothetical protein